MPPPSPSLLLLALVSLTPGVHGIIISTHHSNLSTTARIVIICVILGIVLLVIAGRVARNRQMRRATSVQRTSAYPTMDVGSGLPPMQGQGQYPPMPSQAYAPGAHKYTPPPETNTGQGHQSNYAPPPGGYAYPPPSSNTVYAPPPGAPPGYTPPSGPPPMMGYDAAPNPPPSTHAMEKQ